MKPVPALVALALFLAVRSDTTAAPRVALETRVVLEVEAWAVEDGHTTPLATAPKKEVGPSVPGAIDLVVPWGPTKGSATLHLVARFASLSPEGEAVLQLESSVARPGRAPVTAAREVRLMDDDSGLFDVYEEGGRRLLLTLHVETVIRAVPQPPAEIGEPVRFTLAIERVDGERAWPLETNSLHTFVGQSVEYSFRRGEGDALESVRLSLLPTTISGDLITIEADIDGVLPGAAGAVLVSHHERIVASRGATSRLGATAGTPPAGYRFQVTPDF